MVQTVGLSLNGKKAHIKPLGTPLCTQWSNTYVHIHFKTGKGTIVKLNTRSFHRVIQFNEGLCTLFTKHVSPIFA